MRTPLLKALLLIIPLFSSFLLVAQDSSSVQKQIWPEMDVYYRINERFRLYSLISSTRSNSEYTDGTAGIFIDYFALPWLRGRNDTELSDSSGGYYWWFRMGYSYSDAPPSDKKKIVNIFETETNNTFHLPADIILQTRNRLDWRWVNGEFQPIYRPRAKFVRNLKTEYLTFNAYLWSEYFFYLNDNTQDRLRICFGVEIKVLKFLDFETYYLHQFQNKQYVEPLNAIGVQFNLYFKSKKYAEQLRAEQKKL
jgi:Protein of unknown function (DUF2490)